MRAYLTVLIWLGALLTNAYSVSTCPVLYQHGQRRQDVVPWNVTWAAQPAKWWKTDYLIPYCIDCKDACPACVVEQLADPLNLDCKDMYANDESIASRSWKLGDILTIIMAHAQELLPKEKT